MTEMKVIIITVITFKLFKKIQVYENNATEE